MYVDVSHLSSQFPFHYFFIASYVFIDFSKVEYKRKSFFYANFTSVIFQCKDLESTCSKQNRCLSNRLDSHKYVPIDTVSI